MPERVWIEFARSDAGRVIDMVSAVAATADRGVFGDGVEVVVEAPPAGRLRRLFGARFRAQARIVVTKAGGEVGFPFDIQLVSEHGGRAAGRLTPRRGWAVSDSAGLAFLIYKSGPRHDWGALVGGAVAALGELRPRARDAGWRARIDRTVHRR